MTGEIAHITCDERFEEKPWCLLSMMRGEGAGGGGREGSGVQGAWTQERWSSTHLGAQRPLSLHSPCPSVCAFWSPMYPPAQVPNRGLGTALWSPTSKLSPSGVSAVAYQYGWYLGSWDAGSIPARHSGLRIWRCQLGHNYGSDLIPGLGNPYAVGRSKKGKKKNLPALLVPWDSPLPAVMPGWLVDKGGSCWPGSVWGGCLLHLTSCPLCQGPPNRILNGN